MHLEQEPAAPVVRFGLLRLASRGFVIVFLTSLNVAQISKGHYVGAFVVGAAISFVWFTNSKHAAHTGLKWAREAYALGAAVGTVAGMFVGGLQH